MSVKQHPEQVDMAGGKAASSKGPALHLIPTVALEKIADRFELGIARKGDKAWNALSNNQEVLEDREFLIERCGHILHHALKLRDQLSRGVQPGEESLTDNATAVAWGAIFLTCAAERLAEAKPTEDQDRSPFEKPNMSASSGMGIPKREPVLQQVERVQPGRHYRCANGRYTGQIVKISTGNYAGTIPDVIWGKDGRPIAINRDISYATLQGYAIFYETY